MGFPLSIKWILTPTLPTTTGLEKVNALISPALLNIIEMTSLVYSGRNNWKAVTGWELGAPWIRSGFTSWTPRRLIRANTPWSYSMGTAPTNCQQTCLGKVSWVTPWHVPELLSRSPSNRGKGFLSPLLELELISIWNWGREDSEGPTEARGEGKWAGKSIEAFREPWHCWGKDEQGAAAPGMCPIPPQSLQVASWKRELSGLQRLFQTVGVFFLLWTSLWKERTQCHLFQQYTNRAVFPEGRGRYHLEGNYIYPCNPSTDNNNIMLNLLSQTKQKAFP